MHKATRRALVRSLAAVPVVAGLLSPGLAMAQATRMVVFRGFKPNAGTRGDDWVMGWAIKTPDGWTGMESDWTTGIIPRDFTGSFGGRTWTTPAGTPNTSTATSTRREHAGPSRATGTSRTSLSRGATSSWWEP